MTPTRRRCGTQRVAALAVALCMWGSALAAEKAAPRIKGMPAVDVTSANDPTKPVPGGVRWFGPSHQRCLEMTRNKKFALCFLGDSITQGWPADLFGEYFGKLYPANFGIGGDRAENVLWRLQNGELVGTSPRVIVLMLGTNNAGMNTPGEIALGVATVVKTLRTMLPKSRILLLGILPRADANRAKTDAANAYLAKMDDGRMVRYLDMGRYFVSKGKIKEGLLSDAVHLTRKGYTFWARAMYPTLAKMMKR